MTKDAKEQQLPESLSNIISKNPSFWMGEDSEDSYDAKNNNSVSAGSANKSEILSGTESISKLEELNDDFFKETNEIDPSSFDLNFAEFPIAHLSKRLPKGVSKTKIKYSDWITGKDGIKVERTWTITSNAEDSNGNLIGLGGPTSVSVFYEIMQIWKDQGNKGDKIYVGSYFGLLKRLGWGTGGVNYQQLDNDLRSIYDLKIETENAYYDKELNKYVDCTYKPFIGWALFKKNQIKDYMTDYGYIQVHPDFAESFPKKSLYYLPFESSFFHQLTSHEQKLAFYLTKIFNPYRRKIQSKYTRNILELCGQLPIYGEARKQKYYLLNAAKGLINKNFILLENFEVEGDNITLYNRQQTSMLSQLKINSKFKSPKTVSILVEDILKICGDKSSTNFYTIVAKYVPDELIYKALSEARQEGKHPAKLFTLIIMRDAKEYLNPKQKIKDISTSQLSKEEQIELNNDLSIEQDIKNREFMESLISEEEILELNKELLIKHENLFDTEN